MEADREVLCGPKGRHQVERPAWRGGSVDSQVTLGGRQVELPRLRVRSAEGEVPLASFLRRAEVPCFGTLERAVTFLNRTRNAGDVYPP